MPGVLANTPPVPDVRSRRRDIRVLALGAVLLSVAVLGYGLSRFSAGEVTAGPVPSPVSTPGAKAGFEELVPSSPDSRQELSAEIPLEIAGNPKDASLTTPRQILRQAEQLIRKRQYDAAIEILNTSVAVMKNHPESYVLVGRALEGKRDFREARVFYMKAINLDPFLPDAYWGYATASESLGDLESAMGAMRSYLHTEPDSDPKRLRIAQARSALWEWEAQLGRGPWGPTKGIPPGFTASELKRDGKGVGIKVAIPGTERPDGSAQAEIKSQKKFRIFPRD